MKKGQTGWTPGRAYSFAPVRGITNGHIDVLDESPSQWRQSCIGYVRNDHQAELLSRANAAPSLYEALERASERLHNDPNDENDSELTQLCKDIRAALALARGEGE